MRRRHRHGRRERERQDIPAPHGLSSAQSPSTFEISKKEELRMLEDEEQRIGDRLDGVSKAIENLSDDEEKEVKNNATRR
jgi:hypothetical protein